MEFLTPLQTPAPRIVSVPADGGTPNAVLHNPVRPCNSQGIIQAHISLFCT